MEPRKLARQLPAILIAGWLLPGAGHAWMGKRRKGMFLALILMGTFAAGLAMGDFRNVSWERHPISFVGQAGIGLSWLAGWAVGVSLPTPERPAELESLGLLYTAAAALLNVLCLVDVYERIARLNLPPPPAPRGAKT